jgi:hypothetical protein
MKERTGPINELSLELMIEMVTDLSNSIAYDVFMKVVETTDLLPNLKDHLKEGALASRTIPALRLIGLMLKVDKESGS